MTPRYLICTVCNAPALASKESGVLQSAAFLSSPVVRVTCARCGHTTTLTSQEFAQQPAMSQAQIAADTCDLPVE